MTMTMPTKSEFLRKYAECHARLNSDLIEDIADALGLTDEAQPADEDRRRLIYEIGNALSARSNETAVEAAKRVVDERDTAAARARLADRLLTQAIGDRDAAIARAEKAEKERDAALGEVRAVTYSIGAHVLTEREACAQECDDEIRDWPAYGDGQTGARACARRIRARSAPAPVAAEQPSPHVHIEDAAVVCRVIAAPDPQAVQAAISETKRVLRAEQPAPAPKPVVTKEMIERARRALYGHETWGNIRAALEAALGGGS